MDRVLIIAIVCLCAFVGAEECKSEVGLTASTTTSTVTESPKPQTMSTTPSTPPSTPPSSPTSKHSSTLTSKPASTPARTAPLTLPGVRPMLDRSNSSEPIPCTCGIFLTNQCKGREQPVGLPAISHEFKRATPNTAYGVRQCTSACVDMIVKHLPNSGAILCSSVNKTISREKAYLFIKNHRNKWLATRLSAGKEFCCKDGHTVRCPK